MGKVAKSNGPRPAQDKIEAFGLDAVCERLIGGSTLTELALEIGVDIAQLLRWLEACPQRSARARAARTSAAKLWDERAQHLIEQAPDKFGLEKANSLAHHYRWRAAKIAPREYGDKQVVQHEGAVTSINLNTDSAIDAAKSYRDIMGG